MSMTSNEHMDRAEELLESIKGSTYSGSSSYATARAVMALAHINAAAYRKAEEDAIARNDKVNKLLQGH